MDMSIWAQKDVIVETLHQCALHPRALKSGSWACTLVNGKPFQVEARMENDWLVLETDGADTFGSWWSLLELNGKLGVNTKFVLRPRTEQVALRSEVLLFEDVELLRRLSLIKDELVAAMGLVHELGGRPILAKRRGTKRVAPAEGLGGQLLKELCDQAGWPGIERPSGGVIVELEVADAFHQASVALDAQGQVLLISEFSSPTAAKANVADRAAAAQFLLRVSGLLRLVRAEAVEMEANETDAKSATELAEEESSPLYTLRFAALLADDANAAELHEALANLSMACELAARETQALRDRRLADRYLQTVNGRIEAATLLPRYQTNHLTKRR